MLLLDTHVLLWWLADSPLLSPKAVAAIRNEPVVFVSAASVWEIAIKRALGKLEAPDDLVSAVAAYDFRQLLITFEHAAITGALPRHHDDPFDRMLIAQAQCEGLTLVTNDGRISQYKVPVLTA